MLKTRFVSAATGVLNDFISLRNIVRFGDSRLSYQKNQLYSTANIDFDEKRCYHSASTARLKLLPNYPDYRSCRRSLHFSIIRNAKKSRSSTVNESEIPEDVLLEDLDEEFNQGEKIINTRLNSDRLDAVMKVGFQMSRNKIEKALYSDLIRVNGDRPKKKSQLIREGDEVDFILRYNKTNPAFLDVNRLKIIYIGAYTRTEDEDSDDEAKLPVRMKRAKNLTIENYQVPVKGNIESL